MTTKGVAGTVWVPPVAIGAGIVGAGLMAYGGAKALSTKDKYVAIEKCSSNSQKT